MNRKSSKEKLRKSLFKGLRSFFLEFTLQKLRVIAIMKSTVILTKSSVKIHKYQVEES